MGLLEIAACVEEYEELKNDLKQEVCGQDKVIEEVIDAIVNSEVYEKKSDFRPKGMFLFAGPPGVGKTFLAEKIAEEIGYSFKRFDMSSYNGREDGKLAMFGMDGAWKNSKEGTLLEFVYSQKGRPCIILLDEFEKAHQEVILQFLQILESGRCESIYLKGCRGNSEKASKLAPDVAARPDEASFANVIFFFTTNAGRSLYENGKQPSPDLTKDVIIDAIRSDINPETKTSYFPDAILSRLQTGTVVMFRHLNTNELLNIGKWEFEKNIREIRRRYQLDIDVEDNILPLLLLREGGQVDARNYRKIAESFLREEITRLAVSLRQEKLDVKKIHIGVDPDEKEALFELMFGEQQEQEVVFVCEDEAKLRIIMSLLKDVEGVKIKKTTDYEEALSMVKEDVFNTPLVFAIMPSIKNGGSLTMDSSNNMLQSRKLKNFRNFIENTKAFNEKANICVVGLEHLTNETKKDLLIKGATDIIDYNAGVDIKKLVENRVEVLSLNSMAFEFARKGKALKFDIVPLVEQGVAYIRLRFFEKIDNIKGTDGEFLVGQERMPNVSFDMVVGGERIKEEAADFISFLQNPKSFVKKGLSAPKGLLFYGPAGTGKTYMAKAIAHEAGVPFIATNGGDIKMGRENKTGAELLKKYFAIARKYAPAILFIDEMETIALNRTGADPYADTLVNTLLSEMDGFEGHDSNPVVVIGATNAGIDREHHVDGRFLDPAVVRRFTRKFFVDVPIKEERLIHLAKRTGLSEQELETAAQMSQGLSFGKINNAVEIAKRLAVREGRALQKEDVENAVETENYGEARERNPESKIRTAYHEAGHACIGCLVGGALMPDHATIVSRGDFGGYVGIAGDEKGVCLSKEFMENRVRMALAGRCAEVIHYGMYDGLTAGPSSDIKTAYHTIYRMVCHLGMDEEVGMAYYADPYDSNTNEYTHLPEKIQNRINELLTKYYNETMSMIRDNMELFEEIAQALLEKESLGKSDLEVIAQKYKN